MNKIKIGFVTVPCITTEVHKILATATYFSLQNQMFLFPATEPILTVEKVFIAVVNKCSDEYLNFVKDNNDETIINEVNCLAKAWNIGIERAIELGCDYIVVPNLDVIVHPEMTSNLIKAALETTFVLYSAIQTKDIKDAYLPITRYQPVYVEGGDYFCFMVRKNFFEVMGKFYEGYKPAYFEDNEMDRNIKLKGFASCKVGNAYAWHYGSGTVRGDSELSIKNNQSFELNQHLYENRWGGIPGEEIFNTPYGDDTL